ncbi:AAA family ATPase [Bradyrhizobium sp. Tv2a-2]|uniref:ATP-binding protein n=1 Tax=Bradyrhizobium sp. Tv2a-2 TaxID=113395 RepID=UPI0003F89044|nr:AAA family ATPase [Bradyrhizobium sp. Tv2a-2]
MLDNEEKAEGERGLQRWLDSVGLSEYTSLLVSHRIDLDAVGGLTEPDLAKLGVPLGDRKRLRRAIAQLPGAAGGPRTSMSAGTIAERRQLTVMFCDMVGSTSLSAQFDPEDVRDIIAGFRETCVRVVNHYEGFAARYVGDGILVYFGYPNAHEDDAERAVRAALEIVQALSTARTSEPPLARGYVPEVRIGVATGLAVVGDLIGQRTEERAAAVGETPNLAARLQGLAPPNGIVIAPSTHALLRAKFEYERLGTHEFKGISEKIQAWRVVRPSRAETRFAATVGPRPTALVNRDEEMALLLARWRQAKQGNGQVVLLSGEPGIGKSRIVEEIRDRIAGDRHAQVFFQCSPYYTSTAFHPFVQQLKFALGLERESAVMQPFPNLEAAVTAARGDVERVVPLFGALLSIQAADRYAPSDLSPQLQKEATVAALADHFAGLAQDLPLVIAFEDAHWIDPTSREVLDLLVDKVQGAPILVIVTARAEFQPSWKLQHHITTLTLMRLNRPLQQKFVERVAGAWELPKEIVEEVLLKTDGVPLFIEELTKTVIESDFLTERDGRYVLVGPWHQLAIPATLTDSLMARLDRMGPFKRIAQIGGTIGREFSYELLSAVADTPTGQIDAALNHLDQAGLIGHRGEAPDAVYSFKHVLIQDAARSSLLHSERRRLHARIASALAAMYPETTEREPELLAYHLTESGQGEQAVRAWLKAGKQAARLGTHLEAIGHLRRGLLVVQASPDMASRDEMELEIRLTLGYALIAAKGYGTREVEDNFARGVELGLRLKDDERMLAAIRGLWMRHFIRADMARAHDLSVELLKFARCQRAKGSVAPAVVGAHFVEAHRSIGMTMLYRGRFLAAQHHLQRAVHLHDPALRRDLAERLISPDVLSLSYLGYIKWFVGQSDAARQHSAEAISRAEDMRHPYTLAFALIFGAYLCQHLRDAEETRHHAARAMAIASKHGFLHWKQQAAILHGWALTELGDIDVGLSEMRTGLDGYQAQDSWLASCWFRGLLAQGYARAGLADAALRALDDALAIAGRTGDHFFLAECYRLQGEINFAKAGVAAAVDVEALFLRSLEIARAQSARSWELRTATSLARLWREIGRHEAAAELLLPILRSCKEGRLAADITDAVALANELNVLSLRGDR